MLLAVWVFLILGTPREVSWLSQREKRMAQARVAQNGTGSDRTKKGWNSQQAWEALKDPQTHFFFWVS
jgi:ACS family allantoate permease-like MFS transporter